MNDSDTRAREAKLDSMLADSFPASDPPSFTPVMGVAICASSTTIQAARKRPKRAPSSHVRQAPAMMGSSVQSVRVVVRRAYAPPEPDDGYRVLVDRVWPRGVSRDNLQLAEWNRVVAPSTELRRWYGHRLERWEAFRERYGAELLRGVRRAAVDELTERARAGRLTLVVGARDVEHSQGAVLWAAINERLEAGTSA